MTRRLIILFLEFSAGLAGNLVAGWIQQGVWFEVFTPLRLLATILGAGLMLLAIVWIESRPERREQVDNEQNMAIPNSTCDSLISTVADIGSDGYDVFISHATEDKDDFVRPLALALDKAGFRVWYDEFTLEVGDSLREVVDNGLAKSRYGIIVLSKAFLEKDWPRYELNGLFAREIAGRKVILPIWHNVARSDILAYSPMLADKFALSTQNMSIDGIVKALARVLTE
jgi:hypothetical protein